VPADIVVASWNVHSGVDGWSRPFDVVEGCRSIDADVLILQETWSSDGGQSLARLVGESLGYRVHETAIARALMFTPDPEAGTKWGPALWWRSLHGTRVDRHPTRTQSPAPELRQYEPDGMETNIDGPSRSDTRYQPHRIEGAHGQPHETGRLRQAPDLGERPSTVFVRSARDRREAHRGTIGLAVLTRLETGYAEGWDLGQLRSDPTRRSAIAVEVLTGRQGTISRRSILVVGTHLSHLRQGSPVQISRLRKALARRAGPAVPAVLAGDMNLPGLPLSVLLPGWKRCVRGPTWPAWHPLGQSDHILLTSAVRGEGEVLPIQGSDHLPVRARLSFS